MARIAVDRLQPGVFISLTEIGWLRHPFLLNEFRITSERQVRALREMGLKEVVWDPSRSTAEPLKVSPPGTANTDEEIDFGSAALASMLDDKRRRVERVRALRETLARREREYEQSIQSASSILRLITAKPLEAHTRAKALIQRNVDVLLNSESVAVHLVNQKAREIGLPQHSLNVMVLSLLLGKALDLSEEEMRSLGMGALLHDVGKHEIPPRILRAVNRTPPEEEFYRAHIGYGIKDVSDMRELTTAARNIIACHHERFDGSGFPNKLVGEKIPRLARIVAIANRYDNLCNPLDVKLAKMPVEALAQMLKRESGYFETELLNRFIRMMGIYPPGTFVRLSNGCVGLVMETDPNSLLRPLVMLYDAEIPRSEALVLDLAAAELAIEAPVNPETLPTETIEYLAPRGRVDYYVEGR